MDVIKSILDAFFCIEIVSLWPQLDPTTPLTLLAHNYSNLGAVLFKWDIRIQIVDGEGKKLNNNNEYTY